jgi:hypothetical protein
MDRLFPVDSVSSIDAPSATPRTARRTEREEHAVFEHAVARSGRAEHEWLNPDVDSGSAFEIGNGRVLVLPNRCMASTDGRALELQLEIAAGSEPTVIDLLYRLPDGSWLNVEDGWDWPLHDAEGDDREQRTRIELTSGRMRVTAKLEAGARLCVRLTQVARAQA